MVRGEDGLLRTLSARAVTLACGGFEGNKEMLTRYLGANACDLPLLAPGLAFNQGAGITMAMEIGAGTSGQFDMLHTELRSPHIETRCLYLRSSVRYRRQRERRTLL